MILFVWNRAKRVIVRVLCCIVANKKTKTKGTGKRCREYMVSTCRFVGTCKPLQVALIREANIIKQKLPTTRSFKSTQISHNLILYQILDQFFFSHTHTYIYIYKCYTRGVVPTSHHGQGKEFKYWVIIRLINSLARIKLSSLN